MIDLPPPSYERTIEAILKCGIRGSSISIKYEDYLQSDEVTIDDLGMVTEQKVRCLKSAVHPFYVLTIRDPDQAAEFHTLSARIDRPAEKTRALKWLEAKGLQDRLPNHDPSLSKSLFATKLEQACGLEPGSALEVVAPSALTVRRDFLSSRMFGAESAALECLLNMFAASDAEEHGMRLVIIGNEALREEEKK